MDLGDQPRHRDYEDECSVVGCQRSSTASDRTSRLPGTVMPLLLLAIAYRLGNDPYQDVPRSLFTSQCVFVSIDIYMQSYSTLAISHKHQCICKCTHSSTTLVSPGSAADALGSSRWKTCLNRTARWGHQPRSDAHELRGLLRHHDANCHYH